MNVWERGSNWRRLFMGWLGLGWIVAIVLIVSRGTPVTVAHAATSARVAATKTQVRGYSPIGLTFDTCNDGSTKYVWIIAQDPNMMPPAGANERLVAAVHHVRVLPTDRNGNTKYSNAADSDLLIYVLDPASCTRKPPHKSS